MALKKKNDKVVVIYNGVSREQSKKNQIKKKEVIYVGRIVKEKGVHLLLMQ